MTNVMSQRAGIVALAFAILLVPGILATQSAQAQTYSVLYSFRGPNDGAYPVERLLVSPAGDLYGTTPSGGKYRNGTIFKFDPAIGEVKVRYSFSGGEDGNEPDSGLVRDAAGNFYGTTRTGGDPACLPESNGCGTVFKLDVTGKKTVLHNFTATDGWPTDGYWPPDLRGDSAGNLYGVTYGGGAYFGVVFKIDSNGIFSVLSNLPAGQENGWGPTGALAKDSNGNLYGVTSDAGWQQVNSPGYSVICRRLIGEKSSLIPIEVLAVPVRVNEV